MPRIVVATALLLLALATPPAHALQRATQSDSATYRTGVDDAGFAHFRQLLRDVDADAERISLRWGQIARACEDADTAARRDHELDCYDWAPIDDALESGRAHYLTVREVPCWLHRDCSVDPGGHAYVGATAEERAEFSDELEAFLVAAASRYGTRIDGWSVWNEPNGRDFWSETASGEDQPPVQVRACHFVDTYVQVVEAVREVDGGDQIDVAFGPLGPSSARQPLRFLEAAGACTDDDGEPVLGSEHVDALALHSYPGDVRGHPHGDCPSWEQQGILDRRSTSLQCIDHVRERIDERSDELLAAFAGAPLWVLETAYEDATDDPELGIDPLQQARWLALALERLAGAGAEVVSWYPAIDGGDVADWQSGLARSNVTTRRPLALAFQAPLAVRRLDDGSWQAWTPHVDGRDASILVSDRCEHELDAPVDERYDFTRVDDVDPGDHGIHATFDELAAGSCLAVGDGDTPLPGLVIGIRESDDGDDGELEPYAVSARVIDDVRLDPWGDVIVEGDDTRVGNPSARAIVRHLLGSNEPVRIDPALPL